MRYDFLNMEAFEFVSTVACTVHVWRSDSTKVTVFKKPQRISIRKGLMSTITDRATGSIETDQFSRRGVWAKIDNGDLQRVQDNSWNGFARIAGVWQSIPPSHDVAFRRNIPTSPKPM